MLQQPDAAETKLKQLLSDAQNTAQRIAVSVVLAELYIEKEEAILARNHAQAALELIADRQFVALRIEASIHLGASYLIEKDFTSALDLFRQSRHEAKLNALLRLEAQALYHMAYVYYVQWRSAEALAAIQSAYDIYQTLDEDPRGKAICLVILGNIYNDFADYETAHSYFEQSLPLYKKVNDLLSYSVSLYALATNAVNNNKLGIAEKYFTELKQMSILRQDSLNLLYANLGLGRTYNHQDKLDSAKEYLQTALKQAREMQLRHIEYEALTMLSGTLMKMQDIVAAENYIDQARNFLEENGDVNFKVHVYELMFDLKSRQGKYEEATLWGEKWKTLYKKIVQETNKKQTHEMKVRYEVEREVAEKKLLAKTIEIDKALIKQRETASETQKKWLVATCLLSLVLIGSLLFLTRTQIRLYRLVNSDNVTGIANRYRTLTEASRLMHWSRRLKQPFSLVIFHLDGLKSAGSQLGDISANEQLKDIARMASTSCRSSEFVGRISDDEFLLVMPNRSLDSAFVKAGELKMSIDAYTKTLKENGFPFTSSFGVVAQSVENDMNQLLEKAILALQKAKSSDGEQISSIG
nr:diguanylate cyclase [Pleionea sp. CnH1-48]